MDVLTDPELDLASVILRTNVEKLAILPAGTGHHCLMHSRELMVIGAYPPAGKYNLCRGSKAEHARALASVPKVPLPATDPVFGPKGPLVALWRP